MPRQDVPYPTGAICRLRERIGELFDLLGEKLAGIQISHRAPPCKKTSICVELSI